VQLFDELRHVAADFRMLALHLDRRRDRFERREGREADSQRRRSNEPAK
jgi:hypothetical protein